MGDPKIGPGSPPVSSSQVSGPDTTTGPGDVTQSGESQKSKPGFSNTDTFESGKPRIDLFPKDVLERAAALTPQQQVNAHLSMLRNASSASERAAAIRGLREALSKMTPGEQAKVLTDSKVMETMKQVLQDTKSPAAGLLKDLLRGTVGDIVKVLQAVKPDVSIDPKKMKIEKGGVEVDVPKLLQLLKKDYKDIL